MQETCPRCKSRQVIHDRGLAGKLICSRCGAQIGSTNARRQSRSSVSTRSQFLIREKWRTAIAWLLPAGLVLSYLYFWANPRAVTSWVSPYRASARNDWQIKTPADIELLIDQAQQGQKGSDPQIEEELIRKITNKLTAIRVRFLISDNVMQHAGGEWDPAHGEVRIRPSTVSMGTAVLVEALAHEAAHVAQSCRGGGLNKNSEPMGIPVDPAKTYQEQLASPLYKGPPANKAIELEAFSVGQQPEWVLALLDHFCKS